MAPGRKGLYVAENVLGKRGTSGAGGLVLGARGLRGWGLVGLGPGPTALEARGWGLGRGGGEECRKTLIEKEELGIFFYNGEGGRHSYFYCIS